MVFFTKILALFPLIGLVFASGLYAGDRAASADGKWTALADHKPFQLVILSNDDQGIARTFDIIGKDGTPSRIEGVYTDPTRENFIVTLRDVAEYWLIATNPNAPPVYEGFVHSREAGMIEAIASSQGLFARRRVELSAPLSDLKISPDYRTFTGLTPDGSHRVIVNLNVNREIGRFAVAAGDNGRRN